MATELRLVREVGPDVFIASVCDNWPALDEAGFTKGREVASGRLAEQLRTVAAEHEPTHGKYWPLKSDGLPDLHHVANRLAEHLEKQDSGKPVVIRDYGGIS